jgi:uncharacterized protein (DUF39 family)
VPIGPPSKTHASQGHHAGTPTPLSFQFQQQGYAEPLRLVAQKHARAVGHKKLIVGSSGFCAGAGTRMRQVQRYKVTRDPFLPIRFRPTALEPERRTF